MEFEGEVLPIAESPAGRSQIKLLVAREADRAARSAARSVPPLATSGTLRARTVDEVAQAAPVPSLLASKDKGWQSRGARLPARTGTSSRVPDPATSSARPARGLNARG